MVCIKADLLGVFAGFSDLETRNDGGLRRLALASNAVLVESVSSMKTTTSLEQS